MNNLLIRIISSFLLIPFFLYFVYLGNYVFYSLTALIFVASIFELRFLLINKIHFLFLFLILLFFIFCLIQLRGQSLFDFHLFIWICLIVWLSDTGGFVVGKLVGGPKLSQISPKKTVSGFIGSLLFAQISFLFFYFVRMDFSFSVKFFCIQLLLSTVTVFGDLFFSYIKRKYNIKDFSSIIPGHGGLLDRIDGFIFVIIVAFVLKINDVY